MIPRRAGSAPSPIDLNGTPSLPPVPQQPVVDGTQIATATPSTGAAVSVEPNHPNPIGAMFMALSKFVVVCKRDSVSKDQFETLVKKGLIVCYGDFAVCSEKGLVYLVDFEIVK